MKIALPAPAEISLDRLEAARVIVPLITKTRLVLIGCGGTGSVRRATA
jgi:hypothetical protein